jgi:excisionase family DNA binding protein
VNKRLININELSEYVGLSTSTIYSWVSQRRIPFVKCGRLTKFDLQRIDEWIKESSVEEEKFH